MTSRQATLLALGHLALVVFALLVLCLSGCGKCMRQQCAWGPVYVPAGGGPVIWGDVCRCIDRADGGR